MSFRIFTRYFTALVLTLLLPCLCLTARGQSGRAVGQPVPATPPAQQTTVKPNSTPKAPSPLAPATQQAYPQQPAQVITIVHRLSGWKLRTLLTLYDAKRFDPALANQFIYTNIVAGYVLGNGRYVIARLPEADAEMLNLPAEFGFNMGKGSADPSAITLVRRDGSRLGAKFIGLDGSTWLTLLEAEGLGLPQSRDAAEESLAVGQRVRLFAPQRADKAQPAPAQSAVGGTVFMRIGEIRGIVTDVARSSTGRVTRLNVRAEGLSPQVIGGVVLNDAGETVGLVESTAAGEARIMPTTIVKSAAERLIKRRASVPRPLLGVRGEAISATTLKQLETSGWKPEVANNLLVEQKGLLLTMVAPNSPAALADLRAGDVVVRVNNSDVKTSEDFTFFLNEAGGGASVQFTVLRAAEASPREVTIKLSEALNLRRATEMEAGLAERYAKLAAMAAQQTTVDTVRKYNEAVAQATPKVATQIPQPSPLARPSTIVADLDWIILPAAKPGERQTSSMMLINVVRAGSDAEKLGLRAGDIIISVNGQTLAQNEWASKFLLRRAADLSLVVMRGRERVALKYSDK